MDPTDGLDTLRKLKDISGAGEHHTAGSRLLILSGRRDGLMPQTFAREFRDAYGDGRLCQSFVEPEGQHAPGRASFEELIRFLQQLPQS